MKIIAYRNELIKYAKTRDELGEMLNKNNRLDSVYLNVCGYIIPLNKVYSCTKLNTEINFENVEWELR